MTPMRIPAALPHEALTPPGSDVALRLQQALGDDYELGELLGRGGFADVYLAWDRRLKREVAVKTVRSDLASSPAVLERFRREAEAMARLRHPHVIPVYAVGESAGIAYFIMPRITGETLASALGREDRWSFSETVRVLREAAGALAEAHRHGIIHRDVKPENIMLDGPERRVVVMDFGIAKTLDETVSGLTGTGVLVGSPHYMSPEQATGDKNIDHLSDQYSLGIVGYRMLTGRLPFEADSVRSVLYQQAAAAVIPLRELRPDIPAPLTRIIERALEKDPGKRFASMEAFTTSLAGIASEVAREFRIVRRIPPMSERWANARLELSGNPRRLVIATVVALVAFVFAYVNSESAIVREVAGSRDESIYAVRAHLTSRALDSRDFAEGRKLLLNHGAYTYMQTAVGRDSADALIRAGYPVLSWQIRRFKPSDLWTASFSMGQHLESVTRVLADTTRRATVSADSARVMAEATLRQHGFVPAELALLRQTEIQRPYRVDRTFTWSVPGLAISRAADTAKYEVTIEMAGDEAVGFRRALGVPATFQPGVSPSTRSDITNVGILILTAVTVLALVTTTRRAINRDSLQWASAVRWGVAACVFLLAGYYIPDILNRSVPSSPDASRLSAVIAGLTGASAELSVIWILVTFSFVAAESLAYEKRPDIMFGLTEIGSGRFAIPEMIPAAIKGYAAGAAALAVLYISLALARHWLGLPFTASVADNLAFEGPPLLGVPGPTGSIVVTGVVALIVANSWPRQWRQVFAIAAIVGLGTVRDPRSAAWEELVVTHTVLLLAALWFTTRHGALATLIALFVAYGTVRAADLLWAGGPFTTTGLAAVALLLVPAALAALAYRQRPEAKKTW